MTVAISVIVPAYNEEPNLEPLHSGLSRVLARGPWSYEIIFVDDASTDGSAAVLEKLRARDSRVRIHRQPARSGKLAAQAAALAMANGDFLVTLDSDLQYDPEDIPALVREAEAGALIVYGRRTGRADPWPTRATSYAFNLLLRRLTGASFRDFFTGMKCHRRELFREHKMPTGMLRLSAVFGARRALRMKEVPVAHLPRQHGASRYNIASRLKLAARDLRVVLQEIREAHSAQPNPLQLWIEAATESRTLVVALAVTGIGIVARAAFWAVTDVNHLEADGLSRLLETSRIPTTLSLPELPGGLIWPPLHFFAISFFHHLLGLPLIFSGRLVSWLAGSAALFVFFRLSHSFFGLATAAIATLFLAFNAEHVLFSTLPMTETPFLLLVLLTALEMRRYHQNGHPKHLWNAIVACTLGSLVRFEGWAVAGLCCLYLAYRLRDWRPTLKYSLLFLAQPIAYTLISRYITEVWSIGPSMLAESPRSWYLSSAGRDWNLLRILREVTQVYPEWMLALAAVGIVWALRERRHLAYLAVCFFFFAIPAYMIWNQTALPTRRYFLVPFVLLLPIACHPLAWTLRRSPVWMSAAAIFIGCAAYSTDIIDAYDRATMPKFQFSAGTRATAQWIRANRAPGELLLLDAEYMSDGAGWPLLADLNGKYVGMIKRGFDGDSTMFRHDNLQVVSTFLLLPNLRYFVYFKKFQSLDILKTAEIERILRERRLRLTPVFEEAGYEIVRIDR